MAEVNSERWLEIIKLCQDNDTNGDGDCGRKLCALCHPENQPMGDAMPEEQFMDEVVDGIRRRAYKLSYTYTDDETQEVITVTRVMLIVELPMGDGRVWGQQTMIDLELWEDKPAMETVWSMTIEEARINIAEDWKLAGRKRPE